MRLKRREFLGGGAAAMLAPAMTSAASNTDPIDQLEDMVSGLDPIPRSEYSRRLAKAQKLMSEGGIDALFVEGGSSLEYFTGVSWGRSERMFGVVIPRRGRLGFITPAFEEGRARERIDSAETDIRTWDEHHPPARLVAGILQDRNLSTGKVAVEPTTRFFLVSAMEKECLGVEFINGAAISEGCRMTKGQLELDRMRLANEITKKAYRAALARLTESMTPQELGSRISRAHSKMGVRGGALVLFGPASAFPHGTREQRKLQEGDIVLVDGGCKVQGYSSDVTRTTVFGSPSDKQRRVWEIVREAQEQALKAARPGVTCQQLDRVARRVIEEAGYGPGYKFFTHRLGHGIGLDGHEAPYLVEGNTLEMRPGMTFSDEPGIYIPGEFGVRHEDIMVITDEAAEFLGEKSGSITEAT